MQVEYNPVPDCGVCAGGSSCQARYDELVHRSGEGLHRTTIVSRHELAQYSDSRLRFRYLFNGLKRLTTENVILRTLETAC